MEDTGNAISKKQQVLIANCSQELPSSSNRGVKMFYILKSMSYSNDVTTGTPKHCWLAANGAECILLEYQPLGDVTAC